MPTNLQLQEELEIQRHTIATLTRLTASLSEYLTVIALNLAGIQDSLRVAQEGYVNFKKEFKV